MAKAVFLSLIFIELMGVALSSIVWINNMDRFLLPENTDTSNPIYTLSAEDRDEFGNVIQGSQVLYGIQGRGTTPFDVPDQTTGKVYVIQPNRLDIELNKNITVTFGAFTAATADEVSWTKALIILKDVNDVPPYFVQTTYSRNLNENVPVGMTVIQNVTVADVDVTVNTTSRLIEVSCNETLAFINDLKDVCNIFGVQRVRSSNNDWYGRIILNKPLDFESALSGNSYQIPLTATDGLHWTDQSIEVIVNDVQDSPPVFIRAGPSFSVNEGFPAMKILDYVVAVDQDIGVPREIYYEILQNPGDIFEIDSQNGTIWPTEVLDLDVDKIKPTLEIGLKAREILSTNPLALGDDVSTTATSVVIVQIKDVNDNFPTFEYKEYNTTIKENIANNTVLRIRILVEDKDQSLPNNKYAVLLDYTDVFKLADTETEVEGKATFSIEIKNTNLIDYEKGPRSYTLRIEARESSTTELFSSSALINIEVLDVNDNDPVFPQTSYNKTISENSPVGFSVTTIRAIDPDSGTFGTLGIEYELFGAGKERFRIDKLTGVVSVASCIREFAKGGCLDYETVPRYQFSVTARDNNGQGSQVSIVLNIDIKDENDNGPEFRRNDYTSYIEEGKIIPSPEVRVRAYDPDTTGGPLSYSIITQEVPGLWVIDPLGGVITASRPIQYKDTVGEKGFFVMTVLVTDGIFTDTANVRIIVLDINNNAPIFEQDNYRELISESTLGGVSILTVKAKDEDDSSQGSGQITYILPGSSQGKFSLHEDSGVFSTAPEAKFDFHEQKQYVLLVIAIDNGYPQLTGTATVTIDIRDANNQNPYFTPTTQTAEVVENSPVGLAFYTMLADDPDDGAVLRYTFSDPKEAIAPDGTKIDVTQYDFRNLFDVNVTGVVRVNQPLDRKKATTVIYPMTVTDISANTVQTGQGTLIIYILEYNDVQPTFESYPETITINEELPDGSFIMALIARDEDAIAGYELIEQPATQKFFSINYESGVVTVNKRIDYDDAAQTSSSYFIAEAKDLGRPQLSSQTRVNIIIENVNDNIPEFIRDGQIVSSYSVSLPENSKEGKHLIDMFATDSDREDGKGYGTVRYRMDEPYFEIDNLNGSVTVVANAVLDRETTPDIVIQAIAYDTPNGPVNDRKQNAATIIIRLTDENDNPPVFSEAEYMATIYDTILPNTEVLQVFATDKDEGINAQLEFTKVAGSGDPGDYFEVGSKSGRISVKRSLVRKVGTYTFRIKAQDEAGSGPFSAFANVIIKVLEASNAVPLWVIPPMENMTIDVLEEQYFGMIVYIVSATDEDSGKNGIVDYSFFENGQYTNKTNEFEINCITGVIQAERVFDREEIDRYVLMLVARDRALVPQQATRFLSINIKDVNDNDPTFPVDDNGQPIMYEFSIAENAPIRSYIGHVTATDRDLNDNIYYFIIAGNDENKFRLNETDGNLYLAGPIDTEVKSTYYLDVQASNNIPDYTVIRDRSRRATDPSIVTVKISVGDVNDKAPVFTQDSYVGCISTRSPFSKSILEVQAVDYDAVGSGIVRYRITDGNEENVFTVNEKFGIVANKRLVKDYADASFELTVEARDGINITGSVKSEVPVFIFVTQPSKEVVLQITRSSSEVRLYENLIRKKFEESADIDIVCTVNIQDHVIDSSGTTTTLWSDVFISAIKRTDNGYSILSASQLVDILNGLKDENKNDFDQLYIREYEESGSSDELIDTQPALIVMIIIIILIFLCIVFAIIAFYCIKISGRDKKKLLYKKTYDTQPEPPSPVYDNRAFDMEPIQQDPVPMYASVQKVPSPDRPQEPEPAMAVWEAPKDEEEEEEPRIVTEVVGDDSPPPSPQSFPVEATPQDDGDEFRIETEIM